ncbi:kinase-like domain-containing protein, partial [Mycena albidolilacea]
RLDLMPELISALQMHNIIISLSYLHSVNIVHGDLCGRNILISEEGCTCLTDFGLAVFVELETSIKISTCDGSTWWMALELLHSNIYSPGMSFHCTIKSNVWVFVCVCCEVRLGL